MLKDDFKFWLMPLMGGGGAPWEDGPVSKVLAAKYRDPSAPPDPGNRAPPYRRKKKSPKSSHKILPIPPIPGHPGRLYS